MVPEEVERFKSDFQQLCSDQMPSDYEGYLVKRGRRPPPDRLVEHGAAGQ